MAAVCNTSIVRDSLHRYIDVVNPKCYTSPNSFISDLLNRYSCVISNTNGDIFYSSLSGDLEWSGISPDYIDIEDTGKMPLFSLSMWVYNISGGDSRHSVLRDFWEIVGTSIQFWSYDFANDYWRASASGQVPYDTWTHVTTTWDGSVIRHYINGKNIWTDSNTSSGTSQSFFRIGGYSGRNFKGALAALMVYTKTLSDDEVLQNYVAMRRRYQ